MLAALLDQLSLILSQVVKVENTSAEAWAGIAAIDRGENDDPNDMG